MFVYMVWPEEEKEDRLVPLKKLMEHTITDQKRQATQVKNTLTEISKSQSENKKQVAMLSKMTVELRDIFPHVQEALVEILDTSTLYKNVLKYRQHRELMRNQLQNAKEGKGFYKNRNEYIILDDIMMDPKINYKLIVLIFSNSDNFDRRSVIRKYWGNTSMWKTKEKFKCVFLVGGTFDERTVRRLNNESQLHRDILLETVPEGYFTTSSKLSLGLHWLSMQDLTYKFVLKADDDVFVHIDNVMNTLNSQKYHHEHFFGNYEQNPIPQRSSRYKVNKIEYPFDRYPGFHSGAGVFMSKLLVQRIAPHLEFISPFKLEDVYLAMVVRKHGDGIKPVLCLGYDLYNDDCSYQKNKNILFVHPVKRSGCMQNISRDALAEKL